MAELSKKFRKIISDMENNFENKNDLEYAKSQIANMFCIFMDAIEMVVSNNEGQIQEIMNRQEDINNKVSKIENSLNKIEKDIYLDENYDFEIVCPYCNHEFVEEVMLDSKKEITCPECHNIIELDWNEDGIPDDEFSCGSDCGGCSHGCIPKIEKNNDENDEDEDM